MKKLIRLMVVALFCGVSVNAFAEEFEKIGVPECDTYIQKYHACVSTKVPEASRPTLEMSLKQTVAAWKQASTNETAKASLATTCKQMLDTAKQSMASFSCTW